MPKKNNTRKQRKRQKRVFGDYRDQAIQRGSEKTKNRQDPEDSWDPLAEKQSDYSAEDDHLGRQLYSSDDDDIPNQP